MEFRNKWMWGREYFDLCMVRASLLFFTDHMTLLVLSPGFGFWRKGEFCTPFQMSKSKNRICSSIEMPLS